MSNTVNVRMTAENADLVRAWMESLRGPQAFSAELDKIASKGQRAGRVTKDAFSEAGNQAMQVVGALTGIGSAIGGILTLAHQLKAEWEAMVARRKEAADAQVGVFNAYSRAVNVLADKKLAMNPDDMFKQIVGGARGRNPAELFLAFESGVNVAGDIAPQKVLDTVLAASKMRPDITQEQLKHTVTSSLQLQKEFKGTTPEQAIAGILQSSTAAAPEDVAEYAKHMVPGIVMMRQFGSGKESFEDLASMSIGFGMRAGDTTGRRGTTNLINLLKQVKEETLGGGLVGKDATVEEQLEAVRNSPQMQAKLLGVFAQDLNMDPKQLMQMKKKYELGGGKDIGAHFPGEARTFIPAVELLSPGDNQTKREIAAAKRKVAGLNDEAVSQVQVASDAIAGSSAGQTGELERIRKQADYQDLLLNPAGREEKVLELQAKARQIAGWGPTSRQFAEWDTRLTNMADPTLNPLDLGAAERTALEERQRVEGMAPGGRRDEKLQNLQGVIDEIRALRADLEAAKDKPQAVKVLKDGAGAAVPGQAAPGLEG